MWLYYMYIVYMWTLLTSVWVVEVSLLLNRQGVVVAGKQLQHLEPVHTPSLVGRAGGGGEEHCNSYS